jgi:nicotinate-nucleotide adenylyltransferase
MKIGVFGGSFDPVHTGHLLMAREAAEAAGLDKVLFMPTRVQPFKQGGAVASAQDRLAMLRAATADDPLFGVTEVETGREGVSYTIDSLLLLAGQLGEDAKLWFIVGTDMFLMVEQWHRHEELLRGFAFVALCRPGFDDGALADAAQRYRKTYGTECILAQNTRFDVSSTDIRARVGEGKSISYLVPDPVRCHIREHRLYVRQGNVDIEAIEADLRAHMKPSRLEHTMRTRSLALALAAQWGVDARKAELAALLHDIAKDSTQPGNNLGHGPEAARMAREAYGIEDEEVLNAIRYHTTGRAGMGKLELVVFLADTLEEGRCYKGVERLRGLVREDLYGGALAVLTELQDYVDRSGYERSPDSTAAITWLEGLLYN